MNYAAYEFDVFSVKNLDVECVCEFDNREYYQEWNLAWCSERLFPTDFSQVKSTRFYVIAYLNWDIRKFSFDLWTTKEQVRDRIFEFVSMFEIFWYEVSISNPASLNAIYDKIYKQLCINREE